MKSLTSSRRSDFSSAFVSSCPGSSISEWQVAREGEIMAEKQFFIPDRAWAQRVPKGAGGWRAADAEGEVRFAQAVRIDNVIYVAGQVAWDENGEVVGKGDLLAQSRQVFKNIKEILELAGASLNDIVRLVQYFTDLSDIHAYQQARREAMPGVTIITTGVEVPRLSHPELLVEVEATAVV